MYSWHVSKVGENHGTALFTTLIPTSCSALITFRNELPIPLVNLYYFVKLSSNITERIDLRVVLLMWYIL